MPSLRWISMSNSIFIFTVLLTALTACNSDQQYKDVYTLIPAEDPLVVPIGSQTTNFVVYSQYFRQDNIDYLAILNYEQNRVEIYNLDTKLLFREIVFYREGPQALGGVTNFYVESLDSLLVDCAWERVVGISDGEGNILKRMSYAEDVCGRKFILTVPWLGALPLKTGHIINYYQSYTRMIEQSGGILTKDIRQDAYLNVAFNTLTGESVTMSLRLPEEMVGNEFYSTPDALRTIGYNNTFVYHFYNQYYLYLTDDHITFRKVPLVSNYRLRFCRDAFSYLTDPPRYLSHKLLHDLGRDLLYDRYRECYYYLIMKREEKISSGSDLLFKMKYPNGFILILSRDLEYLGEVFLPDNVYSLAFSFVTPEGLYLSEDNPENPAFDEDYMRFRLFRLNKK